MMISTKIPFYRLEDNWLTKKKDHTTQQVRLETFPGFLNRYIILHGIVSPVNLSHKQIYKLLPPPPFNLGTDFAPCLKISRISKTI